MHRLLTSTSAALALLALAACSGAAPCSSPPIAVTSVPIAFVRMIVPASGATGVPATGLTLQLSGGNDAYGERVRLIDHATGAVIAGGPLVAIVPAPVGTPPQPDHTATVPALSAHTTYDVYVDGTAPVVTTDCPRLSSGGPFGTQAGSFTTQ